ncbi:hypothetical protein O7599_23175 [Streptomyces sp. WMMC500]|uniref:hypothetical protein n=1 Tax=Streptomyces sp. WMMC500 TaxID=3015154 RepID=UPI00248B18B2|nr:hypothetical protein [Streptomyces sp. WMMC500]WBB58528.1 hypothetical protein O7599_23175 [Streptomyces sp. WMMC500]
MFGRRSRQNQQDQDVHDAYDDTLPWPPSPLAVLIRRDGSALVDGQPLRVPPGEPVHAAVLDAMQRRAQDRGEPVEAAILDRNEGAITHVEVAPDGSSRILGQEEHGEAHKPEPRPPAADSPPGTPAAERPSPEPPSAAGPRTADVPPPAGATMPLPAHVPAELAELAGLVTDSLDTGRPERAAAIAFRLRQHTVRTFGAEHPYTVEARALEAFVAHRSGNHRFATATGLELTRIRHRLGDPRAHEELRRAVAAWQQIDDVPSAVDQGRALLDVWSTLAAQGGPTAQDTDVLHVVNRRMHALGAVASTRGTGAA